MSALHLFPCRTLTNLHPPQPPVPRLAVPRQASEGSTAVTTTTCISRVLALIFWGDIIHTNIVSISWLHILCLVNIHPPSPFISPVSSTFLFPAPSFRTYLCGIHTSSVLLFFCLRLLVPLCRLVSLLAPLSFCLTLCRVPCIHVALCVYVLINEIFLKSLTIFGEPWL